MNVIGGYILSVSMAALVVSVLRSVCTGAMEKLVGLLGGIFLAVTVISPLVRLKLPDPGDWMADFSMEGREAARAGEAAAESYSAELISAQVEAYILDKATALGAAVTAAVELDGDGLPVCVTVTGSISPGKKAELSRFIARELGLGEEAQVWSE